MSTITKIFKSGGSQAVRIPKEYRLPGNEVRIRQVPGGGLLIEPVKTDIEAWFARIAADLEKYGPLELDIDEPEVPPDEILFD
jgi:antitoxin VapB